MSLFEGGRIRGAEALDEFLEEVAGAIEGGQGFEGELRTLLTFCINTRHLLLTLKGLLPNMPVRLLSIGMGGGLCT